MGWMTLHSVSVCYPEIPNDSDRKIMAEFIDSFAISITCVNCRDHFISLLNTYKNNVPSWLNSRRDLFLAVCRMHNNVNSRINKPIPKTIQECVTSLENATRYTNQHDFRSKYIEYLHNDWRKNGRMTTYYSIVVPALTKLKKINEEYLNQRELPFSVIPYTNDDVLNFPNQPQKEVIVFPKMSIKNFKWAI